MPARRKKSLKVEVGYPHREHRSKKSRKGLNKSPEKYRRLDYKRKMEEVRHELAPSTRNLADLL